MMQGLRMWRHRFEQPTDLPREAIWPVIAEVARWPELDPNIAALEIAGPAGPGVRFRLRPRGGPLLSFVISAFEPPGLYADRCAMPLAHMTTRHELFPGEPTLLRVTIEIEGPLAWLWGRLVGRKHAAGLPEQTARVLAAARARVG